MLDFKLIVDNVEYDMIRDFGCYPKRFNIGEAEPKLLSVDIPYADGSLDYTEALGVGVKYKDRTLSFPMKLICEDPHEMYTQICNLFSGKRCKCILNTDEDWYYEGRVKIGKYQSEDWEWLFDITMIADPYKYMDMKWSKENINSSVGVYLQVIGKPVVPTITTTKALTVTVGEKSYQFPVGTTKNLEFILPSGKTHVQLEVGINNRADISIMYKNRTL